MRRLLLIVVALACAAIQPLGSGMARATPVDQAAWDDRKQSVTLANGQRIAWVEMGPAEALPLILLHGYTDTSRAWSLLAPELARTRHVYMLDLRGHGASEAPECCFGLADYAYDVKLFMEARGIERAAIGGHSFGSFIAQRFAAEHPALVERVMLFGSTTGVIVGAGDPLPQGVRTLEEGLDPNENGFLAEWLEQLELPAIDREFARHARADCLAVPLVTWREVMEELTDSSTARYAVQIEAPVLVVSGGRDDFFGPAHQAALQRSLPGAEFHLYPDLGHNMIYEAPAEIMPAVAAFLAG